MTTALESKLAEALRDMRTRFTNCAEHTGSNDWAIEGACKKSDAALAEYDRAKASGEDGAEPVAWLKEWVEPKDELGKIRRVVDLHAEPAVWMESAKVTPLFTRPLVVDEAMVERAKSAYSAEWQKHHDHVNRCWTAALEAVLKGGK